MGLAFRIHQVRAEERAEHYVRFDVKSRLDTPERPFTNAGRAGVETDDRIHGMRPEVFFSRHSSDSPQLRGRILDGGINVQPAPD